MGDGACCQIGFSRPCLLEALVCFERWDDSVRMFGMLSLIQDVGLLRIELRIWFRVCAPNLARALWHQNAARHAVAVITANDTHDLPRQPGAPHTLLLAKGVLAPEFRRRDGRRRPAGSSTASPQS